MSASACQQALQEVTLLKELTHPCIVGYRDYFVEEGSLHIVSG